MKHIYFYILFSFLSISVFSQNIPSLEKQLKITSGQNKIMVLNELASAYLKKDLIKAIEYAEEALKMTKKNNTSEQVISELYYTLGTAYYFKGDYKSSEKNFENHLKIITKGNNYNKIAEVYYNIAIIDERAKKYNDAVKNFNKSIEYAKKLQNNDILAKNYQALSAINEFLNKDADALRNLKDYLKIKDNNFKETHEILLEKIEKDKLNITELEKDTLEKSKHIDSLTYEKELIEQLAQKDKEIFNTKEKIHQAEITKQKYRVSIMIIALALLLVITGFIIRNIINKRKTNRILVNKNSEIQQQKEEIETQNNVLTQQKESLEESNNNIKQSITYAKRIQKALIRGEDVLAENFSENFILFKPKDIVSGDFFWIRKIKNIIAIAAVDCTGHGVPGAFMSMLGVSLLNQYVTSRNLDNPGEILNTLRKKVKEYLHQTGELMESKDGMDMSFVLIDSESLEAKYAGANNSLYLVREGNLIEYKPTKNPIGIHYKEVNFETHSINLMKNDSFYLFSDGFADQFGGTDYRKFKVNNFKQMLTENANYHMSEQKNIFEDKFHNWKGNYEQIDDILLIGVKI